MAGRGGTATKRRAKGRASRSRLKYARTVSEEITVLVNTLRELAAIRSTAEDAAGRILDSAEGLLVLADQEEAKRAEEAILSIMTACGFHDLVGQRVTNITKSLDHVLANRMKGADANQRAAATAHKGKSKLELEGPSLGEASHASIDALFREKN
jgi:chemotaxis regulatin CheY-phosphate phosphatase CheZ